MPEVILVSEDFFKGSYFTASQLVVSSDFFINSFGLLSVFFVFFVFFFF